MRRWLPQITDATGIVPANVDVALGLVAVEVLGLRSASTQSSIASPVWVTIAGTWGVSTPPVILNVTAADTGRQSGFGSGDSLTIVFDQAVQRRNVDTTGDVLALLQVWLW